MFKRKFKVKLNEFPKNCRYIWKLYNQHERTQKIFTANNSLSYIKIIDVVKKQYIKEPQFWFNQAAVSVLNCSELFNDTDNNMDKIKKLKESRSFNDNVIDAITLWNGALIEISPYVSQMKFRQDMVDNITDLTKELALINLAKNIDHVGQFSKFLAKKYLKNPAETLLEFKKVLVTAHTCNDIKIDKKFIVLNGTETFQELIDSCEPAINFLSLPSFKFIFEACKYINDMKNKNKTFELQTDYSFNAMLVDVIHAFDHDLFDQDNSLTTDKEIGNILANIHNIKCLRSRIWNELPDIFVKVP